MSDDELILELKSVHWSVHVVDCFSTKDLIWEELLMEEIEKRGYRITPSIEVVKEKEEEEGIISKETQNFSEADFS